ncbi:MAG: hypothetical protein ABH874_01775 [Methanobacteriota archaeon]
MGEVEELNKILEEAKCLNEDKINERVYRLYGLDANDVKVIEQVLNR